MRCNEDTHEGQRCAPAIVVDLPTADNTDVAGESVRVTFVFPLATLAKVTNVAEHAVQQGDRVGVVASVGVGIAIVALTLHGEFGKAVTDHVHVGVTLVGRGESLKHLVGHESQGVLGWHVGILFVVFTMEGSDAVALVLRSRDSHKGDEDGREEKGDGGELHGKSWLVGC